AGFTMWMLGSSTYSAQVAGLLGLPFAFARHFSPAATMPALQAYRATFKPSETLDRPYAMVTVAVLAAETDERAKYLGAPQKLAMARLRAGNPSTYPTPEEAAANPLSPEQEALLGGSQSAAIVGSPDTVRAGLDDLLELTAADEFMVSTVTHDLADRLHSFEIVAELTSTLVRG
ncbi:MAG TPA: MsnO8 family LLM class oxidoreductase, partial [Aldersonia sp.]